MSDFSNYLENHIVNWFRGTNMPSAPAAVYVGLFSTLPAEDGTGGTEVTTTIRVAGRVAVTLGAPTDGVSTNSADVDFGNAAGAATVVGFAIYDAASAGNMLARKAITSQAIASGNPVKFLAGALSLTVA